MRLRRRTPAELHRLPCVIRLAKRGERRAWVWHDPGDVQPAAALEYAVAHGWSVAPVETTPAEWRALMEERQAVEL